MLAIETLRVGLGGHEVISTATVARSVAMMASKASTMAGMTSYSTWLSSRTVVTWSWR
jgi:hypothetical protein